MSRQQYVQTDFSPMQRVTRNRPCPVCGKPDWCLVAEDDGAAICQRIEDGSVRRCGDAGWLHTLKDRHNGHHRHRDSGRRRHTLFGKEAQEPGDIAFDRLSARYQSQLTGEKLKSLAGSLGVSSGSLSRLGVGWDGAAFTFPMSDANGKIVGIRRRFPNGSKISVKGSETGLFIPMDLSGVEPLLVTEGPTDTAAALDLRFDAIGRPNCNSLVEMTVRAVRRRKEITVVSDNDVVGRAGADKLATILALRCPCVRVVHPPDGIKDLRQWFNTGLTAEVFQWAVSAAPKIRLALESCRTVRAKGGRT